MSEQLLPQKLDEDILKLCIQGNVNFRCIDSERLGDIEARMPEVNRAMSIFGKQNSQTSGTLMTLTMLAAGPYRVLRQILAELDRRIQALREAYFDLQEKRIIARREMADSHKANNPMDKELHLVRAQRMESQIAASVIYIEGALKAVGMYQDAYEQIRISNGIRENWDEADFEHAEVSHHIRAAYKLAIRDVHASGRIGVSTCEYLEQFGISPVQANVDVDAYMKKAGDFLKSGKEVSITLLYDFLDTMVEKHRDKWKLAASRLGLKNKIFERWLYTEGD